MTASKGYLLLLSFFLLRRQLCDLGLGHIDFTLPGNWLRDLTIRGNDVGDGGDDDDDDDEDAADGDGARSRMKCKFGSIKSGV